MGPLIRLFIIKNTYQVSTLTRETGLCGVSHSVCVVSPWAGSN